MQIEWSRIRNGEKNDAGHRVNGVGDVFVDETDEAEMVAMGGNPLVELVEAIVASSPVPQYAMGRIIPRSSDSEVIAQKDHRRFLALRKVYEESGGNEFKPIGLRSIAESEGWSEEEFQDVYYYLTGEDLLKPFAFGYLMVITHKGVMEVENTVRFPNRPSEHFGVNVTQHINNTNSVTHSNVGVVQAGVQNTANVQQASGTNLADVTDLIDAIREEVKALPENRRQEAAELADVIEAEVVSSAPSKMKLKAFCSELGGYLDTASKAMEIYFRLFGPPVG